MKKLISLIAVLGFISSAASAVELKDFYVGIGLQSNDIKYNRNKSGFGPRKLEEVLPSRFNNPNVFIGYKIKDDLAVELNYFRSRNTRKTNPDLLGDGSTTSDTKVSLTKIDLDGVYSKSLNDKFKVLGIVGYSLISYAGKSNLYNNLAGSFSDKGASYYSGINIGVGNEFALAKNVALRTAIKYTHTFNNQDFDKMISYNVGAKFDF